MDVPLLWHFAISHFTEKARWALDWKGIAHERRMLFLDYPIRCGLRTGQLRLPVLFDSGRIIRDSSAIIAHLEERTPQPALYPADEAERRRALELEDWFDEELGPHIRAVTVDMLFRHGPGATADVFGMEQSEGQKAAIRALFPVFKTFYVWRHDMAGDRIALGWKQLERALDRLEGTIGESGYLVGERFSVADLTAAALFYPIAMPPEYPYAFPPVFAEAATPLLDRVEGRRAVSWVRGIYRKHRGHSAEIEEPQAK
jgi:glutathione S-transferase